MQTRACDSLFQTQLALPGRRAGKVRDLYSLPADQGAPRMLLVATDRISAFDVVMPTPIPGKGRLLTAISAGWFGLIRRAHLVDDHVLSLDVPICDGIDPMQRDALDGRTMVCRAAQVVPIECVARGYLAGSGWSEYSAAQQVCGVPLPRGLRQCARLPEPIFTPATKAAEGHDENISFERAAAVVGSSLMERLRDLTLRIYSLAAEHALACGMILADTKFEFGFELDADGRPTDRLLLVDEVLTPDSSRYWPLDGYESGRDQQSFDKQFLRNWLLELVASGRWDKTPPGPAIPAEVVDGTAARYREALTRLFGARSPAELLRG
jgi:phosphoribosylaminoimidazole-succinocarboxamide synthase